MSFETCALIVAAIGLFLALLALQWVGYRRGKRLAQQMGESAQEGVSVVEGVVFALMGLLLAFQFSGAASRLDTRRQLAVREANAIGTAYLRLDLLPPDERDKLRELFRQYLPTRIGALEALPNLAAAMKEFHAGEALQQTIWGHAIVFSNDKAVSVPQLLLPALNDMIDITTERKAAGSTHAPIILQAFLILLSLISALFAGNAVSRSTQPPQVHMGLYAAVIALTVYLILDMEHPRMGLIRVGAADQALYDLRDLMK